MRKQAEAAEVKQEVELKLELLPEAAEAFEKSSFLRFEPNSACLKAVYFDTPGKQLRALGYTLRVRRSGDEHIQTVKAGGEGVGLFSRAEWEMPVPHDKPVIDTRTPVSAVLGDAAEELAPAFHVDVERRTWLVVEEHAAIEVALDIGLIRAGERQSPICEIELESKAGEPAALFSLARRIDVLVPVRLGVAAKSERGYRLLEAAVASFKAEPVTLKKDSSAFEAFQTIVRACVRHYRLNEELLLDHYHPMALHQARVAARRLRSALTVFKPMLAEVDVARFQIELRWLAKLLGEARDLDVLIERVGPGELNDSIGVARGEVHAKVIKTLQSSRARLLMIDIIEWVTIDAARVSVERTQLGCEPAAQFAAGCLGHLHRQVIKHGRHLEKLDDQQRHEIRKKAKKLRYASEYFAGLFGSAKKGRRRNDRYIAALEVLQDRLGELNDAVGMPDLLARYSLPGDAGVIKGGSSKKKMIAAAADAHNKLEKVRRFWR